MESTITISTDNPELLVGSCFYENDVCVGKISKIVKRDNPYTIYQIKYDKKDGN